MTLTKSRQWDLPGSFTERPGRNMSATGFPCGARQSQFHCQIHSIDLSSWYREPNVIVSPQAPVPLLRTSTAFRDGKAPAFSRCCHHCVPATPRQPGTMLGHSPASLPLSLPIPLPGMPSPSRLRSSYCSLHLAQVLPSLWGLPKPQPTVPLKGRVKITGSNPGSATFYVTFNQ